jgi:hypothetical protein
MSNKIAQGPDFKEMLIADAQKVSADVIEIKADGTCMTWDGTNLISERGIVRNDRFPHIVSCLRELDWEVQGEVAIPGCGTRVFDVSAKENWSKARLYLFKVMKLKGHDFTSAPATEVREVIEDQMKAHRFQTHSLTIPRRFGSVDEGWDFVKKNDMEGLVLKSDVGPQFKVKYWKEAKWAIVGFEQGAMKGAFLVLNPKSGAVGKISALSAGFIAEYNALLAAKEKPFAEFEYLYLTKNDIPFQPRLRRIGTETTLAIG